MGVSASATVETKPVSGNVITVAAGTPVTVNWTVTGATGSVTFQPSDNSGNASDGWNNQTIPSLKPTTTNSGNGSGSVTVTPTATTTYTLTATSSGTNADGTATPTLTSTASVTVIVDVMNITLTATNVGTSSTADLSAGTTQLNWTVTNLSALNSSLVCTATSSDGKWSKTYTGAAAASGSANVTPTGAITYTLTCDDTVAKESMSVNVDDNIGISLQVNGSSGSATLAPAPGTIAWYVANPSDLNLSCTGSSSDGSWSWSWSGSTPTSGSNSITPTVSSVNYNLTCLDNGFSGAGATSSQSVQVTAECSPSSVANGNVGAYPGCGITCNSGYTANGASCIANPMIVFIPANYNGLCDGHPAEHGGTNACLMAQNTTNAGDYSVYAPTLTAAEACQTYAATTGSPAIYAVAAFGDTWEGCESSCIWASYYGGNSWSGSGGSGSNYYASFGTMNAVACSSTPDGATLNCPAQNVYAPAWGETVTVPAGSGISPAIIGESFGGSTYAWAITNPSTGQAVYGPGSTQWGQYIPDGSRPQGNNGPKFECTASGWAYQTPTCAAKTVTIPGACLATTQHCTGSPKSGESCTTPCTQYAPNKVYNIPPGYVYGSTSDTYGGFTCLQQGAAISVSGATAYTPPASGWAACGVVQVTGGKNDSVTTNETSCNYY
jgi:hypothetical protein